MTRILIAVLALSATSLSAADFRPCKVREVDARCGTITVRENRAEPGGRTIGLYVVILPASERARLEPLFVLQGGPGQAATTLADFYAEIFAGIRRDRDIVLLDQRGTGGSNGLKCDMGTGPDLFPVSAVAECARQVAGIADPRFYTTSEAVADLDELRRALGWKRINLYGTSYGVRVALEYIRLHPRNVRSVILKGTLPPQLRYVVDPSIDTEASLERVASVYPALRGDLQRSLAALPVEGMSRELFGVELRTALHSTPSIVRLPGAIQKTAAGDWSAFIKAANAHRAGFSSALFLGMYFSVTCTEDVWRADPETVKRETAGTIAGDYWYRQLAGACDAWPHAAPNHRIAVPFRANTPALIVSGALDPVTPPRWGKATASILPNSRQITIENASHSFAGLAGCIDRAMTAFVIDPNPKHVDSACAGEVTMPVVE